MKNDDELDLGPDEGAEIPVRVEDRRFWARRDREEDESAPARPDRPSYVAQLEQRLQEAEARRDEVLAAHRRMQQEFDESRARLNRDFETRVLQARAATFRGLLEIADHMDRALAAAEAAGEQGPLAEGIRLIHGQLLGKLREEGVERMELVGTTFDPEVAEAVAVVEVSDPARHDTVVEEVRPGYRLGELTVRPAQVQVGRATTRAARREES
jgi:molecular chaperone GrpE